MPNLVGETCTRCLWSFVLRCSCGGRVVGESPRQTCVLMKHHHAKLFEVRCGCGIASCERIVDHHDLLKADLRGAGLDSIDPDEWNPRPTCCSRATTSAWLTNDSMSRTYPFVQLAHDGSEWLVAGKSASFCPFCGTKLPEVELDPDAEGLFQEIDDAGRCMSCGRRHCGSRCKQRCSRFRIKR